jgi:hypothetical protein
MQIYFVFLVTALTQYSEIPNSSVYGDNGFEH